MSRVTMRVNARAKGVLVSFLAGLLLVGVVAVNPAMAGRQGYSPTYEEVACDSDQFAGRLPDRDIRCGFLTVPENRELPMVEGNAVVLPVAVIKADATDARRDPVLLLAGGPGVSGIDVFTSFGDTLPGWVAALASTRDVILLDTRGTGRAEPSLVCLDPELGIERGLAAQYRMFATTDDPAQERAVLDQAYIDCASDLRAQGIDLNQYDTPTVAQDLADLRRMLGVRRWNVYGQSAGTTVALEVLRQQPWRQRSVVLDSVYPAFAKYDPATQVSNRKAAFRVVVEAAGLDIATVEADLAAIQTRYNDDPYESSDPYLALPVNFTGDDAIGILSQLMFLPDLVPLLELMVANLKDYDVATGEPAQLSLEPVFGEGVETVFDFALGVFYPAFSGLADGHFIAVECADRSQFLEPANYAEVLASEPIYGSTVFSLPTLPNVCEAVDVDPVPVRTYRIRRTGVPSLVLAGLLDGDTPPSDGLLVSQRLGRWSQYVEFPGAAHVVAGYSAFDPASQCADSMISTFIDSPRQPVDTACIGG
ncbi:MAG: alpha/beta hydrolase [Jiangellales bacterium]